MSYPARELGTTLPAPNIIALGSLEVSKTTGGRT
jgi:hypothetical protein